MSVFLWCGLSCALALLFLGGILIWTHLKSAHVGFEDIVISIFGVVLSGLGLLFILLFYRELQFLLKNKQEIIERIFQQVKAPHEVIPQYPEQ